MLMARGIADAAALVQRVEDVAREQGDEYHAAVAGLGRFRTDRSDIELVRNVARERGDYYLEAEATVALACVMANDEPLALTPLLAELSRMATTYRNRRSIEGACLASALAARSSGDLRTCIQLTLGVLNDGSAQAVGDAVNVIGVAALLAGEEHVLRLALEHAERMQRKYGGHTFVADDARHRLNLLAGAPSTVASQLATGDAPWRMTSATLWVVGREAIDAGASETALAGVRTLAGDGPHGYAVAAAITAAVTGDENNWHSALQLAVGHDLRLIAVDALEGLAAAAARTESWAECLRLLAAGQRLRDELGYRWRYRVEQAAVDAARQLAIDNSDDDEVERATDEGQRLDWQAAAAYAGRARGERKRPRHGWASLTPTEQQVVALISDGLTNSQIAAQLLMGQTTVKTHLAHIFSKLGVSTRAQLAGEAARRA
jgi:DNA-binding CsgD family transcriptional regulator